MVVPGACLFLGGFLGGMMADRLGASVARAAWRLRRGSGLAHVGQVVEAGAGSRWGLRRLRRRSPQRPGARGGLRPVAHQMPDMS
jgi:hypothetical protein